jgi:transposase
MLKIQESKQIFTPRVYDIFCGMDVAKQSISVTFTDHKQMVKSIHIPYDAGHLLNYIGRHFPDQKVLFAYEAGPTGYGLHDRLAAQGWDCLVVAPSMVPTAPGNQVKTNRLDSRKISESLQGGQLKSIHVPSTSYRNLRQLTQLRDTYVRQVAAFKNRIKSLLLFEGLQFPKAPPGSQWSSRVLNELKNFSCSEVIRFKLDQLLSSLSFAREQLLETQMKIRQCCQMDQELRQSIRYLMSIPGIGIIVASHLLGRIGDWRQLRNVRQLGCFLGLVCREDSTGDDIRRGSITRAGDARLRGKLIQSAWSAIRHDPELREFYRTIYQRHPRHLAAKKAIVAVARKLTTRIYSVLKEQRPYVVRQTQKSISLTQEEIERPRERLDNG